MRRIRLLYGDAVGGYAPIKDISTRPMFWAPARWRNRVARGRQVRFHLFQENLIDQRAILQNCVLIRKILDSLPEYEIWIKFSKRMLMMI
jgi:hypothetical protein